MIDGWGISCKIALIWMSLDFTNDQSTLVQVMAWCRQATSHYLSQCWPTSLSPYGVTRPQCVNSLWPCHALWKHRFRSTLAQVMVCCLTAPSPYLNQCWFTCGIPRRYCQIFSISCTKSQHLNISCLALQLSLPNPLKPGVKSRMKM